ncbi:helix-turn-helix transcriptional regulator [Bacteroides sp. KFT8]|uniref:LexA family transcriptional regulator n=1 Tax=Bacteroides sp. KFT8 TaxID=2025659 RepID=UPI000C03AFB0|nr:S24 family peptidase [Bacteroides sp. KFT8]
MTTKERFIEYLKIKGIGQTSFEESSGLSRGAISQKSGFSANSIEKIAIACPDLNLDWLITGNGEILKSSHTNIIAKAPMEYGKEQTRPRVPLTAAAGSLSGDSIGVTLEQCEQMPLIHQIPSYDFTMFIKGDSMSPRFESGDEIACRRIDQSRFIQWGKIHVLDTTQGFIIKRIYDDGDKIRCVSYNPEYSDFSVPKEDILSMSLVVGVVSIMEM